MDIYNKLNDEYKNLNIVLFYTTPIDELLDYAFILKKLLDKINIYDKTNILYQQLKPEEKELLKIKTDFGLNPLYFDGGEENIDFTDDDNIYIFTDFLKRNNIYNKTKNLIRDAIINRKTIPYNDLIKQRKIDKENFKNNEVIKPIYIKNLLNKKINYLIGAIIYGSNDGYFDNDYEFENRFFGPYKFPDDKYMEFINSNNLQDIQSIELLINLKRKIERNIDTIYGHINHKIYNNEILRNKIIDDPRFDWNYQYHYPIIEMLINQRKRKNLEGIKEFNKTGLIGPINEYVYSFIKRFGKSKKKSKSKKSKSKKSKSKKSKSKKSKKSK